jgi:hypothetical protein
MIISLCCITAILGPFVICSSISSCLSTIYMSCSFILLIGAIIFFCGSQICRIMICGVCCCVCPVVICYIMIYICVISTYVITLISITCMNTVISIVGPISSTCMLAMTFVLDTCGLII